VVLFSGHMDLVPWSKI